MRFEFFFTDDDSTEAPLNLLDILKERGLRLEQRELNPSGNPLLRLALLQRNVDSGSSAVLVIQCETCSLSTCYVKLRDARGAVGLRHMQLFN